MAFRATPDAMTDSHERAMTTVDGHRPVAAILLAGGRATRMGGIDKPLLEVGGRTLLDAAIAAARTVEAHPIIAVGPTTESAGVTWVREDPPFGGPAAALIAALPYIAVPRTLVLASDLPSVAVAVRLLCAAPFAGDGVCLVDTEGRRQWLIGLYRTDALRAAAATLPDGGQDASARSLLAQLTIMDVRAPEDPASGSDGTSDDGTFHDATFHDATFHDATFDIDTWDDLTEARRVDARRTDP